MLTLSAVVLNGLSAANSRLAMTSSAVVSEKLKRPNVIFVLGGPGAGKGTQCQNLVRDYRFIHLSAGDLLRTERNSGSKDGELIQNYIKEGKIVPVEITVRLLEKTMNQNPDREFLIDGFPRNDNNLEGWETYMKDKANVKGVLYFDCPEEVCVKRILERGKTSGRVDDNEESLRKRFVTFNNETLPVIKYFERKGLVKTINAIPEPDEVYENLKVLMKSL